jgi:hypothetical protein
MRQIDSTSPLRTGIEWGQEKTATTGDFWRLSTWPMRARIGILAGLASMLGPSTSFAAEIASGTLLYRQVDASTFRYDIDLQNSGTTNVGTLWYAWIPGHDFMPIAPTNIVSPPGWSAIVTGGNAPNGFAIQWVNNSGPLTPGHTLRGFGFDSQESLAQLADATISQTFVYSGAPFSDSGFQFNIVPTTHPWHNPFVSTDVDNNGSVVPLDALQVINALISSGAHSLSVPTLNDAVPPFIDVNGDGLLGPLDALQVINQLIQGTSAALHSTSNSNSADFRSAELFSATILNVPEPAGEILTLWGAVSLALYYGASRRKRTLLRQFIR